MKRIALFGGSFNPPHSGHFEAGENFREELGVDEVWFLFSINTHKDPSVYESTDHRIAMGEILNKNYPDMPFVMSGVQDELGTHITYEVLEELQKRHPDYEFVWVMGADNLISFHTWEHFDDILEQYQLAIINRVGYEEKAKNSYAALSYPHLMRSSPEELKQEGNGWCFFDTAPIDMSSSNLLERMRAGETKFEGPFQEVADYILHHGLYGIEQDTDREHCPEIVPD